MAEQTPFVLITGAGGGIGSATAKLLAERGYRCCLLGRSEESLLATRQTLVEPERHIVVLADQRDKNGLRNALLKLRPLSFDAVIANAGLGGENVYGPTDRWQDILDTNLTGTYYLLSEALPYVKLSTSPYKHIVIVSSVLARIGVPNYGAYCASKAGLLGLMRSLAVELAPANILVNAVCPGWVDTDMARQGLATIARRQNTMASQVRQAELAKLPLGKMSTPEEVAELMAYLLRQQSSTGSIFDINNGALMTP